MEEFKKIILDNLKEAVKDSSVEHSHCELCGNNFTIDDIHGISSIIFGYGYRNYSYILCDNCTKKFRKWIKQTQKTTHTVKAFEDDILNGIEEEYWKSYDDPIEDDI